MGVQKIVGEKSLSTDTPKDAPKGRSQLHRKMFAQENPHGALDHSLQQDTHGVQQPGASMPQVESGVISQHQGPHGVQQPEEYMLQAGRKDQSGEKNKKQNKNTQNRRKKLENKKQNKNIQNRRKKLENKKQNKNT